MRDVEQVPGTGDDVIGLHARDRDDPVAIAVNVNDRHRKRLHAAPREDRRGRPVHEVERRASQHVGEQIDVLARSRAEPARGDPRRLWHQPRENMKRAKRWRNSARRAAAAEQEDTLWSEAPGELGGVYPAERGLAMGLRAPAFPRAREPG